jgi:hypothetical protein
MDHPHWCIRNVRDFPLFFRALPILAAEGAHLALADGAWPSEVRDFFAQVCVDPGEAVRDRLTGEFADAFCLPVSESNMAALAKFADCHAAPEIGIHISGFTTDGPFLEWFDLPKDPISVSSSVSERAVSKFALEIGGSCEMIDGF